MSKFASKENLQYLWKKSKNYTDEKMAAVPGAAGYAKDGVLIIDNLEDGEYRLTCITSDGKTAPTGELIHKSPVSYTEIDIPAGCKYIDIRNLSGELQGRVRTDEVTIPVPDYSENDETSPNFIAGRTHWSDYTEVLPETVIAYNEEISGYPIVQPIDISGFSQCTVTYNGVDYTCPVLAEEDEGVMVYILGNFELMAGTGNSGEPFVLIIYSRKETETGIYGGLMSTEGLTSDITLAIGGGKGIVKLDNKFLDLDWIPADYVVDGDELRRPVSVRDNGMISTLTSGELTGRDKVVVYCDNKRYISRIHPASIAGVEEECAVIIGNTGLLFGNKADGGENFVFVVLSEGTITGFLDNGTHIVSVYRAALKTPAMPEKFMPESIGSITLRSSTADSRKLFRLTVDDSGTVTTTEITQ